MYSTLSHQQVNKRRHIGSKLRREVWQKTLGWCWYCGDTLEGWFQVDHVVPVSKGGDNDIDNLVPCCQPCNLAKSDKDLEEFRYELAEDMWPNVACEIDCGADMEMPHYAFVGEWVKNWAVEGWWN